MAAMHFCLVFRFQQPNLPALRSVSTTAVEAEAVVCLFDEVAHGERLVSRFGTHAVPIFWGHGGADACFFLAFHDFCYLAGAAIFTGFHWF